MSAWSQDETGGTLHRDARRLYLRRRRQITCRPAAVFARNPAAYSRVTQKSSMQKKALRASKSQLTIGQAEYAATDLAHSFDYKRHTQFAPECQCWDVNKWKRRGVVTSMRTHNWGKGMSLFSYNPCFFFSCLTKIENHHRVSFSGGNFEQWMSTLAVISVTQEIWHDLCVTKSGKRCSAFEGL